MSAVALFSRLSRVSWMAVVFVAALIVQPLRATTYVLNSASSPVSVTFDDNGGAAGGGRLTATMKATGTVWGQGSTGGGDSLTVSSVTPAADGLSLTASATTSSTGYALTIKYALDPATGDLSVTIGGNLSQAISSNILYPYSFFPTSGPGYSIVNPGTGLASNGLGYAVLPFFGGYLVPTSNTSSTWSTPSSHSRQEWFGGTDGGWNEGWMCIGEPGADMFLVTRNTAVGPASRIGGVFQWSGSNANANLDPSRLSYERKATYRFFSSGGYVAQAQRFREYATTKGWLVPLSTKAQSNPKVSKLIGAPVIYLWGDGRNRETLDTLHSMGIQKALIQISINHVDQNNKFPNLEWADGTGWSNYIASNYGSGWVTGIYDIYGGYRNGAVPPYNGFYYDWATAGAPLPANDTNAATSWSYITSSGATTRTAVGTPVVTSSIAGSKAWRFASDPAATFKGRIPHHVDKFGFDAFFYDLVCANVPVEDYGTKYGNTHSASRAQDIDDRALLLASASVPPAGSAYSPRLAGTEQAKSWAVPYLHWAEGMFREGASNATGSYGSFEDNAYPSVACDVVIPPDADLTKLFTTGYQIPLWDLVYHDCLLNVQHWHLAHNKILYVWDLADNFALIRGQAPMLHFVNNGTVVSGSGVGRTIASVQDQNGVTWNTKLSNPTVAARLLKTYNSVCNWQGTVGLMPMINHRILVADSAQNFSVQNSEFSPDGGATGYGIVVNFGTYNSAAAKYAMTGSTWTGTIRGNALTVPVNEYRTYSWGNSGPDFSVTASPSARSVAAGSATTFTSTVSSLNGFSDGVALAVSGLPSGATATFSPASLSGSASSTLTVATTSATPSGNYTLTLTGTSGTTTHDTTVSLTVTPESDFSLSASPATQTVNAGAGTSFTVTTAVTGGFANAIDLTVSGLPSGATATFNPASVTGAGSSTLAVNTSSSTPSGSYTLTITGTSGALTRTTTATVVVNVPDFSITATPSSRTISAGQNTTYTVNVAPLNGFAGSVNLTVVGLPTGATGSFSVGTISGGSGTSVLTVTTSASTPTGSYTVTVRGAAPGVSHNANVTLVVGTPDFGVSVTPDSQTAVGGANATYTVTVAGTGGFTGAVNLTATSSPSLVLGSFSFSPATIAGSGTSTLTVSTSTFTPPINYTLTITGTSGSITRTATTRILVQGFMQSVLPSAQTVNAGASTTFDVSATFGNGYNGTVAYSVSGLPAGATGVFTPASLSSTGTTTLTVNTTSAATLGTHALTITGVSGALTRTNNVTLTINPAPATVTLGDLNPTYDGTPKAASVTTSPVNLAVAVTYDGNAIAPTAVGSYAVAATVTEPGYTGFATGTLVIAKATPSLAWTPPADITFGTALSEAQLSATASTAGSFTYNPAAGTILSVGSGQALSAVFTPTDTANYVSGGEVSATINVLPAPASITLGDLSQAYDGTPKSISVATTPAGLAVAVTYNGSASAPSGVGSYAVVATVTDPSYTGAASGTLLIRDVTPPVLALPSNAVVEATGPSGSAVTFSASASDNVDATVPVILSAPSGSVFPLGTTVVIASATDVAGNTATGTFTVTVRDTTAPALTAPAPRIVEAVGPGGAMVSYTATANDLVSGAVAVSGAPASGSVFPLGTTTVQLAATDAAGNTATSAFTVTVRDTTAPVLSLPVNFTVDASSVFGGVVTYSASATDAVGGAVAVTLSPASGSTFAVGDTIVTASATDAAGNTATGSFTVTVRAPAAALLNRVGSLNGTVVGSVRLSSSEDVTFNGGASLSGELIVPGSPSLRLNGNPTFGGTLDGAGSSSPSNYTITLNGGSSLARLVRRFDAVALPTVAQPPTPIGTRNVTLNNSSQSAGDFTTLRDLTLNGGVGTVAIPGGTYGSFTANGGSGFVLGTSGATTPTIYHFQSLTLNGGATFTVVGPVVVTVKNGFSTNAAMGDTAHADWLDLRVAGGGLTLNGSVTVAAKVTAPSGTVTINGGAKLIGGLTADRLTLNGNGRLEVTIR